jgi:flagellar hook-basal body complex protein FliE
MALESLSAAEATENARRQMFRDNINDDLADTVATNKEAEANLEAAERCIRGKHVDCSPFSRV